MSGWSRRGVDVTICCCKLGKFRDNMGDPHARKSAALNRLRGQLRKKRESLADQFEFKMYILFHFKDKVNIAVR